MSPAWPLLVDDAEVAEDGSFATFGSGGQWTWSAERADCRRRRRFDGTRLRRWRQLDRADESDVEARAVELRTPDRRSRWSAAPKKLQKVMTDRARLVYYMSFYFPAVGRLAEGRGRRGRAEGHFLSLPSGITVSVAGGYASASTLPDDSLRPCTAPFNFSISDDGNSPTSALPTAPKFANRLAATVIRQGVDRLQPC
ncbi:UDP-glucosyl transferase 85A2 [Striga asiatica]|uniref:UDP-glucosyl transferase 85A2 n=1 Tax=Striga asiatica TaxID=4170 RepID=A0A5A7QK12_STRAF|nr:UDP-glucosyl transferase 85A2 [Striga asiatica]